MERLDLQQEIKDQLARLRTNEVRSGSGYPGQFIIYDAGKRFQRLRARNHPSIDKERRRTGNAQPGTLIQVSLHSKLVGTVRDAAVNFTVSRFVLEADCFKSSGANFDPEKSKS